jgi:hypothetical protein
MNPNEFDPGGEAEMRGTHLLELNEVSLNGDGHMAIQVTQNHELSSTASMLRECVMQSTR